jgi:hypothetical protein
MRSVIVAVAVLGLGGAAWAKDDGKGKKPEAAKPEAAKPAAEEKLTGEVLDMNCYADHKAAGDKHAGCAQKCLAGGAPVGLLSEGKVYMVVTGDHSNPAQKLAAMGGKKVTLVGKAITFDGGGMAFQMSSFSEAK